MPHKVSELNELYPSDCPILLAVRAKYIDWNWGFEHGYIRYNRAINHVNEKVYEHRLVTRLAYKPLNDFHAHHLDGIRTHNDASNLQPTSHSQHARIHMAERKEDIQEARHGKKVSDVGIRINVSCDSCGAPLTRLVSQVKRRDRVYCNQECAHSGQCRTRKPSRDELLNLMQTVGNWRNIGALFSVSDNAARKWAILYQIDPKLCDGRRTRAGDR